MTTSAVSRTLSITSVKSRVEKAEAVEQRLLSLKPGERIGNAEGYSTSLAQAKKELKALSGLKASPTIQAIKKEMTELVSTLERVEQLAKKAQVVPVTGAVSGTKAPWEGQMRPGEKTPLNWAVRTHNHKAALEIRYQIRQMRLIHVCTAYAKNLKENTETAKILKKKPDLLPKAVQVIELLNVNNRNLNDPALQNVFKTEPDLLKILKDPNFIRVLDDPEARKILNGLDVLEDVDADGISPLHEAILQHDREMTHILIFPHLVINPLLKAHFWGKVQEIQEQMAQMKQVDPNSLTPAARAAYEGDIDALDNANGIDATDSKGLTPLHYALLSGQVGSIQYLYQRVNKTRLVGPQKHSYLDYALLSGNAAVLGLFSQLKLPFKLGNKNEFFNYLIASGIFNQQMFMDAMARDPLANAAMDQSILGVNVNAVWTGAALFNLATGHLDPATSWIGWLGSGVQNNAFIFNRHITGTGQVLNVLPNWARMVHTIYTTTQLALFVLTPVAAFGSYLTGIPLPNVSNWTHLNTAADVVSKGYTGLRLWGAVKPVLDRMPKYKAAFSSRPKKVMQCVATDTFNVLSTALMSYWAW